jgi:outer membrane receptor protein involved in Fe transport
VTVNYPNRQERELAGYDWTFDIFPNWTLTNRFAYNNIDYRQRETLTSTFDPLSGLAAFNLWDAYVGAQTIASNLDLNGKLETGPLKHDVLIGTDYWYLDKNIEAFSGPNLTVQRSISSLLSIAWVDMPRSKTTLSSLCGKTGKASTGKT